MGGELLGDLLPIGQLDVCYSHAYPKYSQRYSLQVGRYLYGVNDAGLAWFEKIKEGQEDRNFSCHRWTHAYGISKECSYYFMLMNA